MKDDSKCYGMPRFTHAGLNLDRWFCLACQATMFLPHGTPPPEEHERGVTITPKDDQGNNLPVLAAIKKMGSPKLVAHKHDVQISRKEGVTERATVEETRTALEIYTSSLPGDVSIVKKE